MLVREINDDIANKQKTDVLFETDKYFKSEKPKCCL